MKNKNRVVSGLLALIVMTVSFLCGSTSVVDPILDSATQITKKIFSANAVKDKTTHGYIYSSYLMGTDGEEDYILAQCVTGGYAIFERESMEIIEYSDKESSPYQDIAKEDRYYAGPFAYFKKKEQHLENIKTGKFINKEKSVGIADELKSKIKDDRKKREEQFLKLGNIEATTDISASQELSSPGPTGTAIVNADNYTVENKNYISDYQFFVGNHGHGNNIDGTCVSVAVQLLLGYNHWAKDGRLIPRITNNSQEKFWNALWTEDIRLQPYSDIMRSTNSSDYSDDQEISFYEKLKEYINPYARSADEMEQEEHWLNNGATLGEAVNGINNYMNNYVPERINEITVSYNEPLILTALQRSIINEKLREEINADRPAIASIYVYELEEDDTYSKAGHAIVVYGSQTIMWNNHPIDGFIAHFGWSGDNTHIWFNSSWIKGYLTFKTNHKHDNGIALNAKEHVYECGECGGIFVKGYHDRSKKTKLSLYDNEYIFCHLTTCSCGYSYKEQHNFTYKQSNETFHEKNCECGYTKIEEHFFKRENCHGCGYSEIN